ncbi:hypothetical protein GJAV_G00261070 [Gymnothorax javanicus]|nr:hypothetical protein GJAV_G00261070 [Gymnothorax javanicus]
MTKKLPDKMKVQLATICIFAALLMPFAHGANTDVPWCYHLSDCNDTVWISRPYGVCNESRQSPINIETSKVMGDASLTEFTFNGFSNNGSLKEILNTGRTLKVNFFKDVISVSGGGLPTNYTSLQFHLHWGNGTSSPGSEHTVDGKRYPMEFHIVSIKSEFNGNISLAVKDPEGAAALGFFIEEGEGTDQPEGWRKLANYLANIKNKDDHVNITEAISLDDLLAGVDRTKYYRYLGSLTTPNCDEIVVWTLFKEPVKVSKNLIDLFPTIYVNTSSNSPKMTDIFRNIVATNNRTVFSQLSTTTPAPTPAPTPATTASATSKSYSVLGFLSSIVLLYLLHMN